MAAGRAMRSCHQLGLFGDTPPGPYPDLRTIRGAEMNSQEFTRSQVLEGLAEAPVRHSGSVILDIAPLPPPNFVFLPASSRVGLAG